MTHLQNFVKNLIKTASEEEQLHNYSAASREPSWKSLEGELSE